MSSHAAGTPDSGCPLGWSQCLKSCFSWDLTPLRIPFGGSEGLPAAIPPAIVPWREVVVVHKRAMEVTAIGEPRFARNGVSR